MMFDVRAGTTASIRSTSSAACRRSRSRTCRRASESETHSTPSTRQLDAFRTQAKEINNGRLAMVAVVAYVVQEAMTGEPVTSVSEQFFTPIIYYPWVQHLLTDAFGIASFRS